MRQPLGVLDGRALTRFILLAIVIRLVRDTGVRMMYPFLPQYAAGLGITLVAAGALLTLRTILLVLAPVFGDRADRSGPRWFLFAGYVLLAIGMAVFSLASGVAVAMAAMVIIGLSDTLITPLMQAYVSEHAPTYRRGQVLAMVEYSWALTGILMLPLVGLLIARNGWQAPFRFISVAALLAAVLFVFAMPADAPRLQASRRSLWAQTGAIVRDRSALGTLLVNGTIFIAAESFFVIWGAHLQRNFFLGPAQVGQVAAIIGVAELGGSVVASLTVDRVGKRRSVLASVTLFIIILALMPVLNRALATLVLGLALVSFCIEYGVVCTIPLLGQQRPESRATMLALGVMVAAVTRGATDSAATWLFDNIGFYANVVYAMAALVVAFGLLWRWVQERAET